MTSASHIYQETGGLHNAAISDGLTFFVHQTSGRHNALNYMDFVFSDILLSEYKVLIFSGRISSEILIKAAKIGVGVIYLNQLHNACCNLS
ncbi:formate dehydrogenase accessory sulfurtransferase FdhD [Staphylococcus aureus]